MSGAQKNVLLVLKEKGVFSLQGGLSSGVPV